MVTMAAILDIQSAQFEQTWKLLVQIIHTNLLIGSGEEVVNRSARPPWLTYWISNGHKLNKIESIRCHDHPQQVPVQSAPFRRTSQK